ncbi:MAG: N-acetylmuramoyl-L-alanine amidase [Acidobacteriota bacterium]|nr:N-acetylmuramoyl-L-alanine amidase [Acidobacteriota bacterium]
MPSFASPSRLLMAVAVWLSVSNAASAQNARERYQVAIERDADVRTAIEKAMAATPAGDLLAQAGKVMTSFEAIVRRYPASGYADNALWQAASLADAAYRKFNRPEDLDRAARFYRWLVQEYPSSSLVKRANVQLAALAQPQAPARGAVSAPPPALRLGGDDVSSPPRSGQATLTAIERTVLPDTVRVTLELDREVSYREERLDGPARVFFDLKSVQLTPALMDKVLTYPSDVVNKIRVGRHPDNKVRVVLDLEDVSRYSVFTLYSPFRLVIDAERTVARTAATANLAAAVSGPVPLSAPVSPVAPAVQSDVDDAPKAHGPAAVMIAPAPRAAAPAPAPPPSPAAPAANGLGGFSMARQLGLGVSRIVIDPGHGGHDPGVLGKGVSEAALVLDIALRLEKLLLKEPGVEVVLTRRTDVYIPLEERTGIANRQSADLFLSIHANSSRNDGAKGIETYFLSFASSPEAEAVAARENSASAREMHQLPDIIKAIALNNKLDESRDLANMVQEALVTNLRKSNKEVRSRGVKKAPFVVLIGAAMPSVLAEISFVTNKQELQLLKTPVYKQKIAESLQTAVLRYRRSLKGTAAIAMQDR